MQTMRRYGVIALLMDFSRFNSLVNCCSLSVICSRKERVENCLTFPNMRFYGREKKLY